LWSMMVEGGLGLRERMEEAAVGMEFPSLLHLPHPHFVWGKVIGRTGSRFQIEGF
jgi:hypothetical protein